MQAASDDFILHFREAAPYIHALRGKTVVIGISSALLTGNTLTALAADIGLLAGFGVRLVLVHGTRCQITAQTEADGDTPRYHRNRRITDAATLQRTKQVCGVLRTNLEAALSLGLASLPGRGRGLRIVSGNFVTARPYGVLDGIDMGYTGQVRKIDTQALQDCLNDGAVVLISPIGHSLSGRSFNLSMTDIAEAAAIALQAEKLVFITPQPGITDTGNRLLTNLTAQEARQLLNEQQVPPEQQRLLQAALNALRHHVQRCQIVSGSLDGSLIRELFTRHGAGTSIAGGEFLNIRPARSSDIADIVRLTRPLAEQGILLPRSRGYLENHIGEFSVLEDDRHLCGCVALKTYPEAQAAELACLAISPEARDSGCGERLLDYVVQQAQSRQLHKLFALSTQTGEWFLERGFRTASPTDLPEERRRQYQENGRCSHIFLRELPLNHPPAGQIQA